MPTAHNSLLMRFKAEDTPSGVSRETLTQLMQQLGFERESEVLHHAVRKLADEVLPKYELDDGPLTTKQVAGIRKAAGPSGKGRLKSSLF